MRKMWKFFWKIPKIPKKILKISENYGKFLEISRDFTWKSEKWQHFLEIFWKFREVGKHFRILRKLAKNILFFTQKFCQNKRSKLKSMKKAKKVVGVLWGCSGGAKNEDEFFSKNSVNFFEKPTSYWNLKKNWKNWKFFQKISKIPKKF